MAEEKLTIVAELDTKALESQSKQAGNIVEQNLDTMEAKAKNVSTSIEGVGRSLGEVASSTRGAAASLGAAQQSAKNLSESLGTAAKSSQLLTEANTQANAAGQQLVGTTANIGTNVAAATEKTKGAAREMFRLNQEALRANKEYQTLSQRASEIRNRLNEINTTMAETTAQYEAERVESQHLKAELAQIEQKMKTIASSTRESVNSGNALASSANRVADGMQRAETSAKRFQNWLKEASKTLGGLGILSSLGNRVSTVIDSTEWGRTESGRYTSSGIRGAATGLMTGAMLGSIVPGIGTAIGAVAGTLVGAGTELISTFNTLNKEAAEAGKSLVGAGMSLGAAYDNIVSDKAVNDFVQKFLDASEEQKDTIYSDSASEYKKAEARYGRAYDDFKYMSALEGITEEELKPFYDNLRKAKEEFDVSKRMFEAIQKANEELADLEEAKRRAAEEDEKQYDAAIAEIERNRKEYNRREFETQYLGYGNDRRNEFISASTEKISKLEDALKGLLGTDTTEMETAEAEELTRQISELNQEIKDEINLRDWMNRNLEKETSSSESNKKNLDMYRTRESELNGRLRRWQMAMNPQITDSMTAIGGAKGYGAIVNNINVNMGKAVNTLNKLLSGVRQIIDNMNGTTQATWA